MLPDHLQSRKADLAFMLDPIPDTLESHLVIRQDLLCAVMNKTNPLALKQKLSLSDLHGQKLFFLDQLRILNEKILKKAINTKNSSIIASVRTSLMLYIVIRAFAMQHYAG